MLSASDFDWVSQLVKKSCGISLQADKIYLAELRLSTLASKEGFRSPGTLVKHLTHTSDPSLQRKVVDVMTTNETSFFRDLKPFEFLRKELIPQFLKRRPGKQLNIWSAACATGQEPYSIALLLQEHFPELFSEWQVNLLATDLSFTCLEIARRGVYNQFHVNRGLPVTYLVRYFEQHGEAWHLKPQIRQRVRFEELNLLDPWNALPPMDIIFMSNVLMYFELETKKNLLQRVRAQLKPDGVLFMGGSENPFGLEPAFVRMSSQDNANCYALADTGIYSVYAKKGE